MRRFCSDISTFPYLIMAACEREERGVVISYRGAERFRFGGTHIAKRCEHLSILYSGYPH